jgi:hypothetical protein
MRVRSSSDGAGVGELVPSQGGYQGLVARADTTRSRGKSGLVHSSGVGVVATDRRSARRLAVWWEARTAFAGLAGLLALGFAARAPAQPGDAPPVSPLRIEKVDVSPERPGNETLCRLTVRLHNAGAKPMYAFAFDVKLEGVPLPVYERQLFLQAIPPGESADVRLYNFWTTETARPRPADGKLDLEVVVREALWLEITTEPAEEGEHGDPVEVWSPAGEVPHLPVSGSRVLELAD